MATRFETQKQKNELKSSLRGLCRTGQLLPGAPVPSERELALRHHLSRSVVAQTLAELIDEGLLYSVPRQGTFVGYPKTSEFEFYLLALRRQPQSGDLLFNLQTGFEERIAQLGGTSLVMQLEPALKLYGRGDLPPLAGVFEPSVREGTTPQERDWQDDERVALVRMNGWEEGQGRADLVSFDDRAGGRQATQHLLILGHRRIAFLGMHSPRHPQWCGWSSNREEGWRTALDDVGESTAGLAFHPQSEPALPAAAQTQPQIDAMKIAARPLALDLKTRRDITAVVAASDAAALGLVESLREAEVPAARWPAIVGFDNLPLSAGHLLTSLRLPWEELGRVAADLLWERRHGRFQNERQHRQVAMRLIARLTCRAEWSHSPAHAALVSTS